MNSYAVYLMSFAGWILTRRAIYQDDVCKHIAIALNGNDDKALIKSSTVALTDPNQNKWAFLGWGLILISIYFKWSDAGFLNAFLMLGISMVFAVIYGLYILPKPTEPKSIADVLKALYRRKSEYEKQHDVMRVDAIDYYIKKVEGRFRLNLNDVDYSKIQDFDGAKPKASNNEIIGAFGDLMQLDDFDISAIHDVKELSFSKSETVRAFCEEIKNTQDEKMRGYLESGLLLSCHFFEGIGEPLSQTDMRTINEMMNLFENVNSVEDASKINKEKLLEVVKNKKPFDKDKYNKFRQQALFDFNEIAEKVGINKIDI